MAVMRDRWERRTEVGSLLGPEHSLPERVAAFLRGRKETTLLDVLESFGDEDLSGAEVRVVLDTMMDAEFFPSGPWFGPLMRPKRPEKNVVGIAVLSDILGVDPGDIHQRGTTLYVEQDEGPSITIDPGHYVELSHGAFTLRADAHGTVRDAVMRALAALAAFNTLNAP